MKLDISQVPSAMEELAQTWGGEATPRPEPRPRALPCPPARRPRPFADSSDKGRPGFYGGNPAAEGIRQAAEAKKDAMRAMARDVPNPAGYARYMPAVEARELQAAQWSGRWFYRPDIDPAMLAKLKSVGLAYIDAGDRELSSFACRVRRALMEDDK